jgi:hypothetical protein
MQPLPKGVTGFDSPGEGVPLKRFTSACHAAARQIAGRVEQVLEAYKQVTPNFHEALMTLRDRLAIVRVLCNAHYPIVVFATRATHEGDMRLEFSDCPELAEALGVGFSIITRQEACAGVTDELVAELGEAELLQMRYWRPQRIGDVIFNYWD